MTGPLQPTLDDFERRLRELEIELAELRALTAGTSQTSTVTAPSLEELVTRGDLHAFFRQVERSRQAALAADDLDTLLELSRVVGLAGERAPDSVQADATRLGYALRRNIRFVGRKLGVPVEGALRAEPAPEPEPRLEPPPVVEPAPAPPLFELPDISRIDLFGAKALAIAGGIVTLLGIVFFFVLAVNRGWIGPEARVALGGIAAAIVYGAGLELRRRYGATHSSLAAVAAGIAGGYMVLLAAAQLYHFVGHAAALVIAAAVAALAVATALRWHSQMIAGLGLLGAMLAPVAVAAQDGLSATGVGFAALMAVATAIVAIRERWDVLLVAGIAASLPQAFALAMQPEYQGVSPADVVAVSAVFAAVTVGTGIARQLRADTRSLLRLPTSFLFLGAVFGVVCALRLYGTPESRGFALLAVAVALCAAAAPFAARPRDRDLSALLAALGLVVGGIAFGELMSGSPLAFAWAGESAVLAWLAVRIRDLRYQLWALVYFAAAVIHVLAIDMTPAHLFKPLDISAGGALAVVAVAAAAALIALQTSSRPIPFARRRGVFAPLSPILWTLGDRQWELRIVLWATSAVAAVYALSLGVLAAISSYDWGRVTMFALWSALGLGLLAAALARRAPRLADGAVAALGITVAVSFAVGQHYLEPTPRGVTFAVVGATVLAAALVYQLLPRLTGLAPAALGFTLASVALGLAAIVALFDGNVGDVDSRGLAILVLGGLYAVLAAALYSAGQRDFTTLLWATALVLGYGASERLLPGSYHVLALSIAAAGLAWLSRRVREPRFLAASAAALLLGAATVAFSVAPPTHLFAAHTHPGAGAGGAIFVAVAAVAVGYLCGEETELRRRFRTVCYWSAGILTVYGLSLFILALFQAAFSGSVDTNFHRGHTAVSALWGLIGLALLFVGLTRYRALRVAGFVMFAVSLAKIFLFDLPSLSSITRALSFLAVGAVLLLGGFFYQRLATAQPPQPNRKRRPVQWPTNLRRVDLWLCLAATAILVVWFGTGTAPLGLT